MARKKKQVRSHADIEMHYLGPEPEWLEGNSPTEFDIARALSWYSYAWDAKKAVSNFFENFPSKSKEHLQSIKKVETWRISPTVSYLLRMKENGCNLSKKNVQFIVNHMQELLAFGRHGNEVKKVEENSQHWRTSVYDRLRMKNAKLCSEIDEVFEKFYHEDNFKTDFDMYKWLQHNNISTKTSNYIHGVYSDILRDFIEVREGVDNQLVEAYSHLTNLQLRKIIKLLEMIVNDCELWNQNVKKSKPRRAAKKPSNEKLVSKIRYQKAHDQLKLASISPEEIIGAKELWTYNTKNKTLARYLSSAGISVKGTTLINFDTESEVKRIGRSEDVLPKISKSKSKKVLNNIWMSLNTKGNKCTGRLNENTVLLKAIHG